ncbi:MAG: DUF4386 domain-containing protein [Chloroflexota bacterium]|nr:DUF4386 domain-containing protein [Chloroflexota bacterium]
MAAAAPYAPTTPQARMDLMRKTALAAGVLYLMTFLSIPRLALFGPVLDNPNYIIGSGSATGVIVGIVLELIVAFAIVGTGVALYPVLKRQNEGVALGFVSARVIETGIIVVGAISLLAIVTLRQNAPSGADAASLVTTGHALVAVQNLTFLIGQGLLPGLNGLLLGYLFFRSGLVPRVLPAMGLIGGPLMISSVLGQMFGINEQVSAWSAIALVPIFLWEFSLGLWLVFKGFRPSAMAALTDSSGADASAVASPPIAVATKVGAA